jgi:hypothetical protein
MMGRKQSKDGAGAAEALAALRQKLATMRDVAGLEATPVELQEAAAAGQLVAANRVKLHFDNGHKWYEAGEELPRLPPQHRLLQGGGRLVTTAARWQATQAYKQLEAYLYNNGGLSQLEAQRKHAAAAVDRARRLVTRLEAELDEARAAVKAAEAEQQQHADELAAFLEKAPIPT